MSTSHREVRDVPWFKSHTDDRKAKLIACNDNPGLGMHDPECVNAEDAKSKVDIEAFLSGIGK
jgi:hypothetical protein